MRCSCGVVWCGVVFCEDPRSVVGVQDQDRVHGEEGHGGRHDCGVFEGVGWEEVVVGCGGGAIKLSNLVNRDCGLVPQALILSPYTFKDFYLPSLQKIDNYLRL